MFSNFNDAFKNKPHYSDNPPQAVINAISSELPANFKYVHDHDGFCRIDAKGGLHLESGTIQVPQEIIDLLPPSPTKEDVYKFAYNAQIPLMIEPDADGNFLINGEKINVMSMVRAPLKDIQFKGAHIMLKPDEFPGPFDLKIGDADHEITMSVKRVPNYSIDVQEYKSIGKNILDIDYKVNLDVVPYAFTFSIYTNLTNARKASDIVTACEIYNSFLDGKGFIAGEKFENAAKPTVKRISQDTIIFWKKVAEIENLTGVSLSIAQDVTFKDAGRIEMLYCSLIENLPTKVYCTYDSVKGKGNPEALAYVKENQEIYLEFEEQMNLQVMGTEIHLYALKGIFGATIIPTSIDYESDEMEYEVKLATVSGKKMYCACQYFLSKEQLMTVRDDPTHIERFRNANELNIE